MSVPTDHGEAGMRRLVFLSHVKLGPELSWVHRRFKSFAEAGEIPEDTVRIDEFRRWAYVLSLLRRDSQGLSLLDIGVGGGQFVNAAGRSGVFSKVTGFDRAKHSTFKVLTKKFTFVQKSLIMPMLPKMQHDIVTCMETLEHIKPAAFQIAVDNLRMLARKRIIVTVPFEEPRPLPAYHFQHFDDARLRELFPDGHITYLAKGRQLRWALVDTVTDLNAETGSGGEPESATRAAEPGVYTADTSGAKTEVGDQAM